MSLGLRSDSEALSQKSSEDTASVNITCKDFGKVILVFISRWVRFCAFIIFRTK
jgi:hypothetical protein